MDSSRPLVVTGQQIGAGWTPALSVVKALQALALARSLGGEAVYWMADEDHDHLEVASTVGLEGSRLRRHRFAFGAPPGTATGWLPWTETHQLEAEALWGPLPAPRRPTLRDHAFALGQPLWQRGLRPYSPTEPSFRDPIQETLERWRDLDLEADLIRQAEHLEAEGAALPLDPREQAAWFSLDPRTGMRQRLSKSDPCPAGCWLSPGAALRPLMQSLLLPVTDVVLGPAEAAYWRLAEPLWDRVGLQAPRLHPRRSVFVVPKGLCFAPAQLEALRNGFWESFLTELPALPSAQLASLLPRPEWGLELGRRFQDELRRLRHRLGRLDRRLVRARVEAQIGMDPERLRQRLFPLGKPQERVLPGLFWLREAPLLDRISEALAEAWHPILVEEA